MSTKIEFVNHASVIIRHHNISLITDPWIEGTAFHNGWKLIEPTHFSYADFESITHIWFSHEHPDHFSPSNIRNIPPEIRAKITILYPGTKDKKVIKYCQSLGFKACVELDAKWQELGENFSILNVPHTDGDSWMAIKTSDGCILNLNDCGMDHDGQILEIKRKIGKVSIDVLLTQFSYANWVGNRGDHLLQRKNAATKLGELDRQVALLKPKYTIPLASFIWFCHQENFYLNAEANTVEKTFNHLVKSGQTIPVVLFPDDMWILGTSWNSETALAKWKLSSSSHIKEEEALPTNGVSSDRLIELGGKFAAGLKANNAGVMAYALEPSPIYIVDLDQVFTLSLSGLMRSSTELHFCDVSMTSEALAYCFEHLWGGATTRINGRYQKPAFGQFLRWKRYFNIAEMNNHGERFGAKAFATILKRKVRMKLKFK